MTLILLIFVRICYVFFGCNKYMFLNVFGEGVLISPFAQICEYDCEDDGDIGTNAV